MFAIEKLLRPNIQYLRPYSSARDEFSGEAAIFLDANENAFGSVLDNQVFNRYPDPLQKDIKNRLAQMEDINANQIFLGNGSDEAIDLLIRAFCQPQQDSILILPPTYGMYQVSAEINEVKIIEVPLTTDYQIDTPNLLKAIQPHTKIIFLCSPNNPTGNLLNETSIQTILETFSGLVVIDEAYMDFCREKTWVTKLPYFPNLVVLKTFSKAWGLAGLRLGMAFSSPEIIQIYNKIKPPYNINLLTQQAVLEALDREYVKKEYVLNIIQQRTHLINLLTPVDCVIKIFPSDANFLLVKVTNPNEIYHYLVNKQIIVRNRSNVQLCEGCLRITVGTAEENQTLVDALAIYK